MVALEVNQEEVEEVLDHKEDLVDSLEDSVVKVYLVAPREVVVDSVLRKEVLVVKEGKEEDHSAVVEADLLEATSVAREEVASEDKEEDHKEVQVPLEVQVEVVLEVKEEGHKEEAVEYLVKNLIYHEINIIPRSFCFTETFFPFY